MTGSAVDDRASSISGSPTRPQAFIPSGRLSGPDRVVHPVKYVLDPRLGESGVDGIGEGGRKD